ncbi:MAG TPA: hypothetical protein VG406_17150 [Isosphaeraceae bacterium]|jgi:hypothetical protein|nr:hypothetical protein [Isosphaeraceae bacterium]
MLTMKTILRRGAACLIGLCPALAMAQDGKSPDGPTVPGPPPTQDKVDTGRKVTTPPRDGADPLPPVPATATDPAPPGTRAVRVDVPAAGVSVNVPGRRATDDDTIPGIGRPAPRGMHDVEGVVVRIRKPGTSLAGEQVRLVVNTTRDWREFFENGAADLVPASELKPASGRQPVGVPRTRARGTNTNTDTNTNDTPRPVRVKPGLRSVPVDDPQGQDAADVARRQTTNTAPRRTARPARTAKPAPADTTRAADTSAEPKEIELVLTRGSKVYTFARDGRGTTLYDPANPNAPSRTGPDAVRANPITQAVQPTNFTNIRDGTFVAVRYRQTKGVNEVVGISLIAKATANARPLSATAGTTTVIAPGVRVNVPGRAGQGQVPGELPGEGPASKPVVPKRPIDPSASPR